MSGFDPSEFLALAEVIVTDGGSNKAARRRTAISRSYYAAFLTAREGLRKIKHYKERKGKQHTHRDVWIALKRSDSTELKTIGSALFDLLALRADSDYELNKTIDSIDVSEAIDMAKNIVADLETADMSKCADPRTA